MMKEKVLPLSAELLKLMADDIQTPFHVYDGPAIRKKAREFYEAFKWVPGGFKNYFAVKALPNPHIMQILKEEGMGADCSSLGELVLAEAVGLTGQDIVLTSNDTPAVEFIKARELGAIINLDDINHLDYMNTHAGLPQILSFRFNPGSILEGNEIIGHPEEAKFGVTKEQLFSGYEKARALGVKRFALHTMVASNELHPDYFANTARIIFQVALEIKEKLGISVEMINLGGGIGIPYKPNQHEVDLHAVSNGIRRAYDEILTPAGLNNVRLVMECGRLVTGPYGYLVSTVLHVKKSYKSYVGLDASMSNLMRPGMYGSYHHITVLNAQGRARETYDVTGSLCENNDKFAIDRELPVIIPNDLLVIHDTGAHGHSMGFQYNAKLRSAEVLWNGGDSYKLIRRHETLKDYFSTLDFKGLD